MTPANQPAAPDEAQGDWPLPHLQGVDRMTMTIRERETLQAFVDKPHASGSLHAVVAALASVALKQEQIRIAQADPVNVAVAKCARCGVDLFPGDDFWMREEDRVSTCWQQAPADQRRPGAPCFRGR